MRKRPRRQLPAILESSLSQAYHDRFLYLFDETVGDLLKKNPEVEARCRRLAAEIFEILAAGLRADSGNGRSRSRKNRRRR